MDANNNQELLKRLYEERERLMALPLANYTLGEVRGYFQDLQNIEERIALIEHPRSPVMPGAFTRPRLGQKRSVPTASAPLLPPAPAREKKLRLSELNLGRYVMTVLAAGLCLLALGIFVLSFWNYLPTVVKYAFIIAMGGVLEGVGFWRTAKREMRAFWLGIAGLGSGTLFLGLVSGSLAWNMYGPDIAAIGLLVWFAAHVWLAYRKQASIFYAVAYIGGIITIWLACMSIDSSLAGELMIAFLLIVIVVVGEVGAWKSKANIVILMNILFCWTSFLQIRAEFGRGFQLNLLPWVMAVLSALCLINIRWLVPKDWGKRTEFAEVIASFVGCMMACRMIAYENEAIPEPFCFLIAAAIIILCGIKSCDGYFLGAALPICFLLRDASVSLTAEFIGRDGGIYANCCPGLLPAFAAIIFVVLPSLLENKAYRKGVALFYLSALFSTVTDRGSEEVQWFFAIAFIFLLAAFAVYCVKTIPQGLFFNKPIDLLAMSIIPGIVCSTLSSFRFYLSIVPCSFVLAGLIMYDYVNRRADAEQPAANGSTHKILWILFMVITYIGVVFGATEPYRATDVMSAVHAIIKTTCLAGISAYVIMRARDGNSRIASALSSIFTHINLFWITLTWELTYSWVGVSLIGLALSTALIICGFKWRCRPMRTTALACSILYVFKITFFDIRLDDGVKAAGALLVAGLICFGISFAYNRLGKYFESESANKGE